MLQICLITKSKVDKNNAKRKGPLVHLTSALRDCNGNTRICSGQKTSSPELPVQDVVFAGTGMCSGKGRELGLDGDCSEVGWGCCDARQDQGPGRVDTGCLCRPPPLASAPGQFAEWIVRVNRLTSVASRKDSLGLPSATCWNDV